MKSVAIVGAGPAGLVTAKILLRAHAGSAFSVTVFEKAPRLGGIWALDDPAASSAHSFLAAHTPTNLSQFQVSFSDLAWPSVDCSPTASSSHTPSARRVAPVFPKAWQAGRYLRAYASKYIPDGVIHYGREVKSTERIAHGQAHRWRVTTAGSRGDDAAIFDHLVVASGFFSRPRVPSRNLDPSLGDAALAPVKMIHTSQFRSLSDLFPDGVDARDKRILILGGGNSVGETGGTVAFALSSERNSSTAGADRFAGCHLVHVTPRPLYGIPPYVPASEDATGFVPVDCRFYDLAARPPDEIVSSAGRIPADIIHFMHDTAQKYVGGDQTDLGAEALVVTSADRGRALQVALSENFSEFVRSGDIVPMTGRVIRIEAQPPGKSVRALVRNGDKDSWMDDIGAVIHATGYTPHESLAYLPEQVKEALEYDPSSHRLPLILDEMQTLNRSIPDLAFVGFYEGPYWGMMEMQARLIAQRWLGKLDGIERPSEEAERLRSLRKGMAERDWDVPQYWLGDYVGHMEHFSRDLKLTRNDAPYSGPRDGILLASRFLDDETDRSEAAAMMQKVYDTMQASTKGAFVARAVSRALQGKWSLHRRIDSVKADFPSGTFEGAAQFHPRVPTGPGADEPFDLEFLYVEKGAFIADQGVSFEASRRYVYRYREADDQLSVWFVKDDGYTVDYHFHSLDFSPPPGPGGTALYTAKADHLCVQDMYKTHYDFAFKGVALGSFRLKHSVKGPKKDYVSDTQYERPATGLH